MAPTAVPIVEVEMFGETLPLKYGFRAYQEIGLNPFDPASIETYSEKHKDCRNLAAQIRAGMLHLYYGKNAPRKGQEPPSVDDVMDELDPFNYVDIWMRIQKAMGVDKDDPEAKKDAGPPAA